jgi:hypothetical protein
MVLQFYYFERDIFMKKIAIIFSACLLGACSSNYVSPRYSISADNNMALKSVGVSNISVGHFSMSAPHFDNSCRMKGAILPSDNLSYESYIQKALSDELKVAGVYDAKMSGIVLSGAIEQFSVTTAPTTGSLSSGGAVSGSWDISLRINSSNGKTSRVTESYEFKSGLLSSDACQHAADALLPAVQDLISKLVTSNEFRTLVTP